MAAASQTAHALQGTAASRLRGRPRAKRAPAQRRVAGVVSIALVACLLAGIVALNVAVLRLNVRLGELGAEKTKLRAENARLGSQLSSIAALPRIHALAQARLGLVPVDPTYLKLEPAAK